MSNVCFGPLAIPEGVLVYAGISAEFIAHCALFIALLLVGTVAAGKFFKQAFHLPVIAGQIIGGIFLGPSCFNITKLSIFSSPLCVTDQVTGKIYALASADLFLFFIILLSSVFTVAYLLWVAGHETDVRDILKVGVTATVTGVLGAVLPIVMTAGLVLYALPGGEFTGMGALGLGLVFAATSVSIPVAMLFEQNKMHLRSSKATLGAAIIDDIVAVILLSVFMVWLQSGGLGVGTLHAVLYMFGTLVLFGVVGYSCVGPVVAFLQHKKYGYLMAPLATGIMLIFFSVSELLGGLAGITGAYFAGLFHRRGDGCHEAEKVISPFVSGILLPLFLGSIGLQIDLTLLSLHDWFIVAVLLIGAIVSKLAAAYVAIALSNATSHRAQNGRWTLMEGYLFGSSMVARGEVGLVVATVLNGAAVITLESYTIAVVVIVLTTIATPIMLSIGFAYQDQSDKRTFVRMQAHDFSINIGHFDTIGTMQMFNIIMHLAENKYGWNTSLRFSEGQRILNLEQEQVQIICDESMGIIFKGDEHRIKSIVAQLKRDVIHDVDVLHAE